MLFLIIKIWMSAIFLNNRFGAARQLALGLRWRVHLSSSIYPCSFMQIIAFLCCYIVLRKRSLLIDHNYLLRVHYYLGDNLILHICCRAALLNVVWSKWRLLQQPGAREVSRVGFHRIIKQHFRIILIWIWGDSF